MKKTTKDIAWKGGKARKGDEIDETKIPKTTLEKWLKSGVLVDTTTVRVEL